MGLFLGWQSYDLEGWCEVCGFYDIEYKQEHLDCEEEAEESQEN